MEALVLQHAEQSWQAALAWLERRLPEQWSLKPVVRDSGDVEQQLVCAKMSLEELIINAKLAAEIAANPPPGLAQNQAALPSPEAETA
jgi:hypothetical protein